MNRRPTFDEQLEAAFRERLDASPEPSEALFARSLAAIDEERCASAASSPGQPRWRALLAAPARFAAAAAIVLLGGTIVFGAIRADRQAPTTASATRVTLDPESARGHIARRVSIDMTVRDVPAAARRIGTLAADAHGEIIARSSGSRAENGSTMHLVVRVPAIALASLVDAIAALGTVHARAAAGTDLARALERNARDLRAAQGSIAGADIARLHSERIRLEEQVRTATVGVMLRTAPASTAALFEAVHPAIEPVNLPLRPTGDTLARGPWFATFVSPHARHRIRALARAASRGHAAAPSAARTATKRNAAGRLRAPDTATHAATHAETDRDPQSTAARATPQTARGAASPKDPRAAPAEPAAPERIAAADGR